MMPFAAAARLAGPSWHKAAATCERRVELALEQADFSDINALAINEIPRARGHDCVTLATDARAGPGASGSAAAPSLEGLRWILLKSRECLSPEQRADLDALVAKAPGRRTARAWLYREQLREILQRKQVNAVRGMLRQWCINVNRSKAEPMKAVAKMIREHLEDIVAWTRTRQTNGFIEALNGLFQAAKRKARGYSRLSTLRRSSS